MELLLKILHFLKFLASLFISVLVKHKSEHSHHSDDIRGKD